MNVLTGTLAECREASGHMVRHHAKTNGYEKPETTEERQDDGSYVLKWETPSGEKLGITYRADDAPAL